MSSSEVSTPLIAIKASMPTKDGIPVAFDELDRNICAQLQLLSENTGNLEKAAFLNKYMHICTMFRLNKVRKENKTLMDLCDFGISYIAAQSQCAAATGGGEFREC
jgi:hypothetical protein